MRVTLSWMDNTGSHDVPVNTGYLRRDPLGYLDALRTGEMWNISVRDAQGRDITSRYI